MNDHIHMDGDAMSGHLSIGNNNNNYIIVGVHRLFLVRRTWIEFEEEVFFKWVWLLFGRKLLLK